MTTILPGSVCQMSANSVWSSGSEKGKNDNCLMPGPSQNDIRNIVSRRSTTTVKIYTPISIKVAPVKHDP